MGNKPVVVSQIQNLGTGPVLALLVLEAKMFVKINRMHVRKGQTNLEL